MSRVIRNSEVIDEGINPDIDSVAAVPWNRETPVKTFFRPRNRQVAKSWIF